MDINTDELKQCAPIIPYIQKHYPDKIPLIKGTDKVSYAKCLWHEEKTASLTFFSNGTYKCFGCGEHGDIITLVQKIENATFQEACKMIGDNVGYEIVLEEPNQAHENFKNMMDANNRRYWVNLQNNGEALRYLVCERGLTKETIDKFRIGFTDRDEFRYRTDMGNIASKIAFPILEHKRNNPKCVGMAYRGLTDEKPKYINDINKDGREGQDPQLAGVFIKGNLLYGFSFACEEIIKANYAIIVEGYFDVLSLYQSGIRNVVGIMGTSLTETQIKELSRYTKNVMLCLDGDNAGTNAMIKSVKGLYEYGFNVAICTLDGGMDPADLCKSLGFDGDKIKPIITSHIKQGIELIINNAVSKYETYVIKERTKALQMAMPVIDAVQDESIKDLYKALLYKRLDIGG